VAVKLGQVKKEKMSEKSELKTNWQKNQRPLCAGNPWVKFMADSANVLTMPDETKPTSASMMPATEPPTNWPLKKPHGIRRSHY
jgi:hypothetical protein